MCRSIDQKQSTRSSHCSLGFQLISLVRLRCTPRVQYISLPAGSCKLLAGATTSVAVKLNLVRWPLETNEEFSCGIFWTIVWNSKHACCSARRHLLHWWRLPPVLVFGLDVAWATSVAGLEHDRFPQVSLIGVRKTAMDVALSHPKSMVSRRKTA